MEKQDEHVFKGIFFFKMLKKKDPGYIDRLIERYTTIQENSVRLALLSEQEMFDSFLELMDAVL